MYAHHVVHAMLLLLAAVANSSFTGAIRSIAVLWVVSRLWDTLRLHLVRRPPDLASDVRSWSIPEYNEPDALLQ